MPPGLQTPPKNPKIQGFGEIPENPEICPIPPIAAGWPVGAQTKQGCGAQTNQGLQSPELQRDTAEGRSDRIV